MPVEAIFRGPRRRWREGLSCNSARKRLWRKGFDKKELHRNPDTHYIKIAVQLWLYRSIVIQWTITGKCIRGRIMKIGLSAMVFSQSYINYRIVQILISDDVIYYPIYSLPSQKQLYCHVRMDVPRSNRPPLF